MRGSARLKVCTGSDHGKRTPDPTICTTCVVKAPSFDDDLESGCSDAISQAAPSGRGARTRNGGVRSRVTWDNSAESRCRSEKHGAFSPARNDRSSMRRPSSSHPVRHPTPCRTQEGKSSSRRVNRAMPSCTSRKAASKSRCFPGPARKP